MIEMPEWDLTDPIDGLPAVTDGDTVSSLLEKTYVFLNQRCAQLKLLDSLLRDSRQISDLERWAKFIGRLQMALSQPALEFRISEGEWYTLCNAVFIDRCVPRPISYEAMDIIQIANYLNTLALSGLFHEKLLRAADEGL